MASRETALSHPTVVNHFYCTPLSAIREHACFEDSDESFHSHLFFLIYKTRIPVLLSVNPLKPELNPICHLLALLGAHHFLHVSRIRVKLLIFRLLMSCIYGAPILDVSRSHTTTQHSR